MRPTLDFARLYRSKSWCSWRKVEKADEARLQRIAAWDAFAMMTTPNSPPLLCPVCAHSSQHPRTCAHSELSTQLAIVVRPVLPLCVRFAAMTK